MPRSSRLPSLVRRPIAALARWLSRAAGYTAVAANAFRGAVVNRLTADWAFAPIRSADQDIRGDLVRLRGRARELARNEEHIVRFLSLLEDNVVGPNGIRLQAKVEHQGGGLDRQVNTSIEEGWSDWCRPEHCTADGRLSFRDVQALAVRAWKTDGEAIVRLLPGFANEYGFAVQLLDADQLDHELNRPAGKGVNEVRMGVEVNAWGRPVAYHIWNRHKSDIQGAPDRKLDRIPADQIIHLFTPARAGQNRGVTEFAPVMLNVNMLRGYREAELVAARTAAAKMGFFQQTAEAVDDPDAFEIDGENEAADAGEPPLITEAAPGVLERLPPGYSFHAWDPQHPTSAFPEFTKSVLRSIAAGLHHSYNSLAADLEGVSYSSIRQGTLAERDYYRVQQLYLVTHLCERIYRTWLKWGITSGALQLGSYDPRRFYDVTWQPRGWTWVDPLKEIAAAELAIALRLDSRTRQAAEQGRDYEEILRDHQQERELEAEYGLGPAEPAQNGNGRDAAYRNGNGTGHRRKLVLDALREDG